MSISIGNNAQKAINNTGFSISVSISCGIEISFIKENIANKGMNDTAKNSTTKDK